MLKSIPLLAALVATATAFTMEVAPGINITTKQLGDPSLPIFNTSNTRGNPTISPGLLEKFVADTTVRPHNVSSLESRQFATVNVDCLLPNPVADFDDCTTICEYMLGPLTAVTLTPYEIWWISAGNCIFEAVNLDPCDDVDITYSVMGQFC